MKKLSLVFSLLAMFAISTINAQAPACKMEAGKCIITNADGTTTVVDAKDCAVKCDATAASTDCAKKCTAAKTASTTSTASTCCSKKSVTTKTVSTTAKSAQAQTVNFLPTAKAEKKCTSAKSACCAKDAKKKSGTK